MNFFKEKLTLQTLKINKTKIYLKILFLSIFFLCILDAFINLTTQYSNNITISMNGYIPTIAHKEILYVTTSRSTNKKPSEITFGLLLFLFMMIIGLAFNLVKYLYLARRGFVVAIQQQGLLLASGRFIEWGNIQSIIYRKKTYGKYNRRPERVSIQTKSGTEIDLSDFKLPTQKAHKILVNHWPNRYHRIWLDYPKY